MLPEGENHQRIGTELATIDGVTYVSLPDGVILPLNQPAAIVDSIVEATLDEATREAIKSASPHCKLIAARVVEKIRARYSVEDEIKLLRIAPSPETEAWNDYAEECRDWGRAQRAALGL